MTEIADVVWSHLLRRQPPPYVSPDRGVTIVSVVTIRVHGIGPSRTVPA